MKMGSVYYVSITKRRVPTSVRRNRYLQEARDDSLLLQ